MVDNCAGSWDVDVPSTHVSVTLLSKKSILNQIGNIDVCSTNCTRTLNKSPNVF